jgi:hypothetical protein
MIVIQNKHKIKLEELLIFSKTLPSALLNILHLTRCTVWPRGPTPVRERVNTESKRCIHTVLIIALMLYTLYNS